MDGIRLVLSVLCGLFATGLGALSVTWIFSELAYGRPHGPSPLALGLLTMPVAVLSGWVARHLYRGRRP